jgi:ADP-ribose pyrophosphatase YjhB (NUDIX family)
MKEKSCGTVLYTVKENVIHYLLIRATDTYCGLPKGHVEAGETEHETALRETREETSIRAGMRKNILLILKNSDDIRVFCLYKACGLIRKISRLHNPKDDIR